MREPSASRLSGSAAFLGRSAEMRWLSSALATAQGGQPRLVAVIGEAGVGKSRLLAEFCDLAGRSSTRILKARGEAGVVLPHRVLADALAPELLELRPDRGSEVDLALSLLTGTWGAGSGAREGHTAEAGDPARWHGMLALEACVVTLARRAPLLLCLDDLHWADRPSLELLRRILHATAEAARSAPVPLLVLCGSRPVTDGGGPAPMLEQLGREEGVSVIELGGLSEDSVARLLESSGVPLAPPRLAASVHELTRGNPMFVLEICRLLAGRGPDRGSGELDDIPLPASITAALEARLGVLGAEIRELLTVAACLGERFSLNTLSSVSGRPQDEIVARLEEGRAEGVLTSDGALLAFAHPMLRHALYRGAGNLHRHRLHLEIADLLSAESGGDTTTRVLEIAHHLIRAGPLADRQRLWNVARSAGDRALAAWAPAEAARYYSAALQAAPTGTAPRERAELHFLAGIASYRAAEPQGARDHQENAIRHYRSAGDQAGLAQSMLEHLRVQITLDPLPYGTLADAAPLEKALADLGPEHARLRGQILSILSGVHWTARQPQPAVGRARDALAVARTIPDLRLESEAWSALGLAQTQTLDLAASVESCQAAVEAARAAGDAWLEGNALARLPLQHFCLGELDRAEATAREAEGCTRRTQDWSGLSLVVAIRASLSAARGDLVRGREMAAELRRLVSRSGYPWGAFGGLRAFAGTAFDHGQVDEAEETLGLLERPGVVFPQPGVTSLAVWVDRQRMRAEHTTDPQLLESFSSVLSAQDGEDPPELGAVASFCAAIEIARLLGAPGLVEVPIRQLTRAYERGLRFSSAWVYLLPRVLGVAAHLAGDRDDAGEWFLEAEQVATASGSTVELARTYVDHARLLEEQGDVAGAHRRLVRARAHFAGLDMRHLEHRAAVRAEALQQSRPAVVPLWEGDQEALQAATAGGGQAPAGREDPSASSRWLREFLARAESETAPDLAADAEGQPTVILISDMAGSTERLERLGQRSALNVMRHHDAILRACLEETGGTEVQSTGDGLLARFESASRAIVCAARIQRAFASHNRDAEETIRVRIGIAEGRVLDVEGRPFGSAVNLAARLCAYASPDSVVVTSGVRDQAGGAGFSFRDLGDATLKGFSDHLRLHEVVW